MAAQQVTGQAGPRRHGARSARKEPQRHGGGGALRVLPLMVILPPLVYYLWICVTCYDGALQLPRSADELRHLASHVAPPTWSALAIYLGWFGFQALLQITVPGKWVEGTVLADGTRLPYKMNGWRCWWITWACLGAGVATSWISPTLLYEQFGPLLTVVNLFAFALAGYLFVLGKLRPDGGRVSGSAIYDYFMGTSLNPRHGRFDWKLFCEARPGLIGWAAIDVSILLAQWQRHHAVSAPMALLVAFQLLYVGDFFFHEEAILTTWDIRHENFGWMLTWGDLVWVPFTYSLQAFYLIDHEPRLPAWALAAIGVLDLAGYYFFRSANLQKHRFRNDPSAPIWGRPPEYLRTERGTLLLVSGWWGAARHVNYLGDLMMGLAWCLLCGFDHLLPYFYIIYFTILLVHRERRDHAGCAQRYGADWDAYCARVRYRILPGVY
jgi:hypothetical protein